MIELIAVTLYAICIGAFVYNKAVTELEENINNSILKDLDDYNT